MGTAVKMHDEIELNSIIHGWKEGELSENEFLEAVEYNDCSFEYKEAQLRAIGMFDAWMTWIYFNIK